MTEEDSRRRDASRREEIREELEKLRVRREQRELERQMYDQELVSHTRTHVGHLSGVPDAVHCLL